MTKQVSEHGELDRNTSVLKTTFVSKRQTASLMHVLDLTREKIDQVSGGLRPDRIILPRPPIFT